MSTTTNNIETGRTYNTAKMGACKVLEVFQSANSFYTGKVVRFLQLADGVERTCRLDYFCLPGIEEIAPEGTMTKEAFLDALFA